MRATIGRKLGFGFGAVLLLTLALGLSSFWIIARGHRVTAESMVNLNTALLLEARIGDHLRWMNSLSDQFILNKPFEKELDPHKCKFGQWYDAFKSDNPDISEILVGIDAPHKKLHEAGAKIRKIYQEGGAESPQITDVYSKEAQPAAKEVQEKIGAIENILQDTVTYDVEKQHSIVRMASSAISVSLIFTVILGVLIAVLVSRSLTQPIGSLLKILGKVGEGDMTQNVNEIKTDDEIGDLAKGFGDMIVGFRTILLKLQEATARITSSGNQILTTTHEQVTTAAISMPSSTTRARPLPKSIRRSAESAGSQRPAAPT